MWYFFANFTFEFKKVSSMSRNRLVVTVIRCLLFAIVWNNGMVKAQISAGNDQTICIPNSATLNLTAPCGGDGTTTYAVTTIPYSATDPYTGTAAFAAVTNNKYSPLIPIGFTFCFFGNSYTQCVIGNNGIVSFNAAYAAGACPAAIAAAATIPNAADPLNAIFGTWVSLAFAQVTTAAINYATYGTAPFRRFVVSFNNVPLKNCLTLFKGQIKLYESTNVIEINLSTKPTCAAVNGGRAVEGIQNSTGTVATAIAGRNAVSFTANSDGRRFCPSAANPYTANWYNATTNALVGTGNTVTVSPVVTTSYIVKVSYTCSGQIASDTVIVNVNNINPTAMNSTLVSCTVNNGTAWPTMPGNAVGPFTYAWTPSPQNNASATGFSAGVQYTVSITDANGCIGVDTITLQLANTLVATGGVQDVSCNGANDGKAWVTVTSGTPFAYLWSPSGQTGLTATNLGGNTYTCTVGDANGCTVTVVNTVIEPAVLSVVASPHSVFCHGGTNGADTAIVTGGTAPYTYTWSPSGGNTATANNLAAGNYVVSVTDAHGCQANGSSTVTDPPAITAVPSSNTTVCVGGSTNVSVTAGGGTLPYTYAWSNGGPNAATQSVSPVVNTNYTVTVTDANGCTISSTIAVTVNPALTVTPSLPTTICGGQSVTMTASASGGDGNYTYIWSNGANGATNSVNPLVTTTYSVTVNDGCGSTPAIGSVTITVNVAPLVKFSATPLKGCPPLTVQFTDHTVANPPATAWQWDFGDGTSVSDSTNPSHIFYNSGYFRITLMVTSSNNCSSSTTIDSLIEVYPKPSARFTAIPPITTISNADIHIEDESSGATTVNYTDFGDGISSNERNPWHQYTDTGTFWIHQSVYNDFGCVDSILGTVVIRYDYDFFIPSAFTPDASGLNPTFQGYGMGIVKYQMDIYDRYGEIIYTTTNLDAPWNGTTAIGYYAREGVYIYRIWIKDWDNNEHTYTGKVTLIR